MTADMRATRGVRAKLEDTPETLRAIERLHRKERARRRRVHRTGWARWLP
ncbi:hypothetical protein [Pseudonocardia dioxanivorans]|nr:hypothetical protein [Pseudonocardia dioxanivorans]